MKPRAAGARYTLLHSLSYRTGGATTSPASAAALPFPDASDETLARPLSGVTNRKND
ncbi:MULTISPECIES: hypothetical protein [unclassified Haloarcula]|uniref:hypothetical protein n=1 Tax=unclassified Haloarcula TaxID=2624677 RepID=UPI001314D621|nr:MULTISPECIES: hypothetical protein [unclassified Haloarcula]